MTDTTRVIEGCNLTHGIEPGACAWCGAELKGRRRRWCREACQHAFVSNHIWTIARTQRVETDGGVCVKCGMGPGVKPEYVQHPYHYGSTGHRRPGVNDEDVAAWEQYRIDLAAYHERVRQSPSLEVNHITSLKDQGVSGSYAFGCLHHQSGLETLCRPCHVGITREQHRARKRGADPQGALFDE